jgi:exopolyphosphatase / guanosine-5'-triphosphate,3'-diphosphate pyrophosphatase
MLYGIVDIGSNTVRLNVYNCKDENISLIFSKKENLGLVFYIKNGILINDGIERLLVVLKEIKEILDYMKVDDYSFFATASLRNIENSSDVIKIINELGIEIDLLSGEEEGELSFYGSIQTIKNNDGILIDLGGGSVEIVIFEDKKITKSYSIPVGSLKMYNEYVSEILPNKEECVLIKKRTYMELDKLGIDHTDKIPFICGVGGSIRAIGKTLQKLNLQENKSNLIDVKLLKELEREFYPTEINHDSKHICNTILHVKPSRIHTIVPALLMLDSITSYFGSELLAISKFSVREGYLYKKILKRI